MRSSLLAAALVAIGCDSTGPDLVTISTPSCMIQFGDVAAYRNEGAEWKRATMESVAGVAFASSISFKATERFEIAYTDINGVNVIRTTISELKQVECSSGPASPPMGYTGTTTNLPSQETGWVFIRDQSASFSPFTTQTKSPPPFDVVAGAWPISDRLPRVLIVRRGEAAPGMTIAPLDFASSEAMTPRLLDFTTLAAVAGENRLISQRLVTAGGTSAKLIPSEVFQAPPPNATVTLARLAAAQASVGDVYDLIVSFSSSDRSRTARGFFADAASFTLLPGNYPVALDVDAGSNGSFEASATADPSYGGVAILTYSWSVGSARRHMAAVTSPGFRGVGDAWELGVPDLTPFGISLLPPGGTRTWGLTFSTKSFKEHFSRTYDGPFSAPTPPTPLPSAIIRTATLNGTLP